MLPQKTHPSTKVLKVLSSNIRLQVLTLLYEKGPQSYTEIMNILKMNPSRDAGRFAYHLKALIKTDLVEPDLETKKYKITELGRLMLEIAEEIDKHAHKRKKILVRTSKLSIEEFDRNKIINSLIKEAGVPTELAQKISREAENRLKKFETKYLTSPLIREVVNTILIEKGLEEYRHKLTRLGLPVHDVTQLLENASQQGQNVETIHKQAGDAVIEEYTLLNVLPRDIADAHISGALYINNLNYWILKPQKIMHDTRVFLKNGLKINMGKNLTIKQPPPKNFASALSMISEITRIAATDFLEEQTFDYFNVFLAPFVKGLSKEEVKEELKKFLYTQNQCLIKDGKLIKTTLGLELTTPKFLADEEIAACNIHASGFYENFLEESRFIASLLLEILLEEGKQRLFSNPNVIVKIHPETLKDSQTEHIVYLACQLAANLGLPYFANLYKNSQSYASYDSTGHRLGTEWKKDWELDTLRTGCLDNVLINLPRIAYVTDGKQTKFFESLNEQLEMATRALEIKYQIIKRHLKEGMLPFASHIVNGEKYLRIENMTRAIGFIGLSEAIQHILGQSIFTNEEALSLAQKIIEYIHQFTHKNSKKPETRLVPTLTPNPKAAERLAKLDVERYGIGKVKVQGSRENPYYTHSICPPQNVEISLEDQIKIEGSLQKFCLGGHLTILNLPNNNVTADELLIITKKITNNSDIGFYTFNKELAYCSQCSRIIYGTPAKCIFCESTDTLTYFKHNPPSIKL